MFDFLCIMSGVFAGFAAFVALDLIVPTNIRFNRVGGLRHWRFGRIGGSLYIRKAQ